MSRPHARRDGFTVIELIIAMTLVGLVLTKLTLVMEQARRAHEDESVSMALGDQANELLDKIAYALVGSSREKLLPGSSAPFFGASLSYQISLGVEDGLDSALDAWLVADALATLTPEHRSALVQTYYAGRTTNEAATVLGVPPGTVKSRVHYGLRALKVALDERGVS